MSRTVPPPPLGEGLVARRVRVADADAVWLRSIVEAYEGLACFYGDGSGVLTFIATEDLADELDGLLRELAGEGSLVRVP